MELQYVLDAKKATAKRMFFLDPEGESSKNKTVTVRKGRLWRDSFTVYLPGTTVRDKLTTLDTQVNRALAFNRSYVKCKC